MIKVYEEQVKVQFGFGDVMTTNGTTMTYDDREQGVIAIGDCKMGVCGTEVDLEHDVPMEDYPIVLLFNNVNSVDSIINSLQRVKRLMLGEE